MALPRYAVLQLVYSDKNVIYYSDEEGDGQYRGFLHCAGEEVVSPLAKIEIERAKTAKGYVHIRCCYNNKYWCRSTKDDYWMAARGNEQEEDKTQWNCTLFKPMFVTDNNNDHFERIRLMHAQTGWYMNMAPSLPRPNYPLFAKNYNQFDEFSRDIYKVIDWESLLILPKFVAFKGYNGHYLTASRYYYDYPYLRFSSDDDSASSVMNEVFSNSDGSVRIKSREFSKFWRNDVNWISVDADENKAKDSNSCWFWPLKISNNVVAFRSMSNNRFCASLTLDGKTDTLNACESAASKQTRMEVKELVLSRSIYNLDFRLDDCRIYSERIQNMSSALVKNAGSQPNTISVKFTYTETTTQEWKASVSLKLGVETSIKAGVPFIVDGEVKITAEFESGYEWGKIETKTSQVETVYSVTVKPRTQLTAYLIATVGNCDVPFSYTQRDTLIDGTSRVQEMNDGVFTGVNCYNFKCETRNEVPLPAETPVEAVGALVHDTVDLVKSPFGLLKNVQSKAKPKKKQ